jgi:hypothetical protein
LNFAAAVQACHLVIHQPGQEHASKPLQKLIAWRHGTSQFILAFQGLQHAGNSKPASGARATFFQHPMAVDNYPQDVPRSAVKRLLWLIYCLLILQKIS